MTTSPVLSRLARALELTWLSGFAYFGSEWLFFATKPSTLNFLTVPEQLAVLFVSPLPWMLGAGLALLLVCLPLYLILRRGGHGSRTLALGSLAILPGFTLACTLFLLVDNFTYTMFGFGVVSLSGAGRAVHSALFAVCLFVCVRFVLRRLAESASRPSRAQRFIALALLLASLGCAAWTQVPSTSQSPLDPVETGSARTNVLVFAADGIDARSMSAYGAERDTTPFIRSLLPESLVFENHFTNCAKTTGSVASLLSGKLPTTTRMVFRPDVFRGVHVYQHVPGLLRAAGYTNGDISLRHFVDARDLNMRASFHYANGRELDGSAWQLPVSFVQAYPSTTLFVEETAERIGTRLLHVLDLRTMANPVLEARGKAYHEHTDRERVDELKAFIRGARRPFFAHVHLMATHGKTFPVEKQIFSAGKTQDTNWDRDFYDDAILQYDEYVREIVEFLQAEGLYDETLLILNTDHGFRWSMGTPLPLIMRFPNAEHAGRSDVNSQRLDVAPTVLDYLGIPRPDWLEGRSLLSGTRTPLDPIYLANRMPSGGERGWREVPSPKPPFYTLGSFGVILGNAIFKLDLESDEFLYGLIEGHTQPLPRSELPNPKAVHALLIRHLDEAGYDTSALARPRDRRPGPPETERDSPP